MNRKTLPLVIMLVAGAITSILTYYHNYEIKSMLTILLVVLLVFYIIGLLIKKVLDSFEAENQKRAMDEGEVIEKEATKEDGENMAKEEGSEEEKE